MEQKNQENFSGQTVHIMKDSSNLINFKEKDCSCGKIIEFTKENGKTT